MSTTKAIKRALVSVYNKDGLEPIVKSLAAAGVEFLSTGGTRTFIEGLGIDCKAVEDLTGYPSILGGRVKTLHPKVFGGILGRRDNPGDVDTMSQMEIPEIDLVIVDLYPFEATVASGACHADIIEKIDIGGISLIRAAAKNYADVAIVASKRQYAMLAEFIADGASTTLEQRALLAREAFAVSSGYDSAIFAYMTTQAAEPTAESLRLSIDGAKDLRYGENPHQQGRFYGDFGAMFDQLHGKEISYNNLLDIDSAVSLIDEFADCEGVTCAILKHNNACGCATRATLTEAWADALAGDPVSAFGGVIIVNTPVDAAAAAEIGKIFFEVLIAPEYTAEALEILGQKKNRILLRRKGAPMAKTTVRTALNGVLVQQRDAKVETAADLNVVSGVLTEAMAADMLFANKIVKHSKSNAIVLARNGMLLGSGVGQTSRVDALRQAIAKAGSFDLDLHGAAMASDAFFPFADCVEIADAAGITAVIQPGGSIRDNDTIEYCRAHNITMAITGYRHFRH
ncbi:MAG: bifunctional phosphoribosylaminoimidazolecarboxamide formyltransferase/IMP cyclohydrolase [Muribaculaceae bacterium]